MNIGHLKNETFVNDYKKWGFSARNHLIDAAVDLLKKAKARELREKWRNAAHRDYKEGNVWESIEGEDFENT